MNYYNGGCRGVVSNSINLSIFIDLLTFFYNEELSLPSEAVCTPDPQFGSNVKTDDVKNAPMGYVCCSHSEDFW